MLLDTAPWQAAATLGAQDLPDRGQAKAASMQAQRRVNVADRRVSVAERDDQEEPRRILLGLRTAASARAGMRGTARRRRLGYSLLNVTVTRASTLLRSVTG